MYSAVLERRFEGPNGMPWMVCTTAGTCSCQAAARPRMPAFELCVCTTSGLSRRNAARSCRYALRSVAGRIGRTSSGISSTFSPRSWPGRRDRPSGPSAGPVISVTSS